MLKFRIDSLSIDEDGCTVVYVHLYDNETDEVVGTKSLTWKNKDDFKLQLKNRSQALIADYNAQKAKRSEIELALQELEEEVIR